MLSIIKTQWSRMNCCDSAMKACMLQHSELLHFTSTSPPFSSHPQNRTFKETKKALWKIPAFRPSEFARSLELSLLRAGPPHKKIQAKPPVEPYECLHQTKDGIAKGMAGEKGFVTLSHSTTVGSRV